MRCPKCGYISFDHLEVCLKCKKSLEAVSAKLQGSVYKVAAPSFLQINTENYEDSGEPVDLFEGEGIAEDEEYIDEDLEILVDSTDDALDEDGADVVIEDDLGATINLSDAQEADGDLDEGDEEDSEIEIDLSQFEDTPDSAVSPAAASPDSEAAGIDLPEELADISDLAPPDLAPDMSDESEEIDLDLDFDAEEDEPALNLDDLDFELGMGGLGDKAAPADTSSEKVLSLDEIDFEETLSSSKPATKSPDDGVGMDDDLDFELDLGGLSIHKDV